MQKIGETQFLYSPSDLVRFLSCNHSTVLDIRNFTEAMKKAEESASNQLLQKKGYQHEGEYLERLRREGKHIVEIPKEPKLQERAELTLKALQSGADVVYQGVLLKDSWRGDADFLIKVSTPSKLGNYSYEVLDTKLARHAEPKHIIQLCAYTDLLEHLQGVRAKQMYLFLGNQSLISLKSDDFFYYYQHAKCRFEIFVTNVPANSSPEPCQYCKFCPWKDVCENQWVKEDHLSLVAKNSKTLGVENCVKIICLDAKNLPKSNEVFDLVFIDPPYCEDYPKIISSLLETGCVEEKTLLVVEFLGSMKLENLFTDNIKFLDLRSCGKTSFWFGSYGK